MPRSADFGNKGNNLNKKKEKHFETSPYQIHRAIDF